MTANPIRTITGPAANLDGAGLLAVDAAGNIYLWRQESDPGASPVTPSTIVEFAAGASGKVKRPSPARPSATTVFMSSSLAGNPSRNDAWPQRYQTPHARRRRGAPVEVPRATLRRAGAKRPGFKVNALQNGFTLTSYCAAVAMHP